MEPAEDATVTAPVDQGPSAPGRAPDASLPAHMGGRSPASWQTVLSPEPGMGLLSLDQVIPLAVWRQRGRRGDTSRLPPVWTPASTLRREA